MPPTPRPGAPARQADPDVAVDGRDTADAAGTRADRVRPPLPHPFVVGCSGCHRAHGFGWCAHAMSLTQAHLGRRGAHFNWR